MLSIFKIFFFKYQITAPDAKVIYEGVRETEGKYTFNTFTPGVSKSRKNTYTFYLISRSYIAFALETGCLPLRQRQ
jgi:hypothetical protein